MKGFWPLRLAGVGLFLIAVLILLPWLLLKTGRSDMMSVMTSVALLSIISSGVWLTFYIGRINIGQGAYALMGGYVSAILVVKYGFSFWLTLPLSGLACAAASVLIGLPILRLRGVYFAMVTLTLTEVARLLAQALEITRGPSGITNIPPPGALEIFGLTVIPDFAQLENLRLGFYYLAVVLMLICFAGMWRLVNSRLVFCAALCNKTKNSLHPSGLILLICAYWLTPFPLFGVELAGRYSPPLCNPFTLILSRY